MDNSRERLGDLVAAAREGIKFYESAARQIDLVSLTVVLRSMAMVRYDLVKAIAPEVPTHHRSEPEDDSAHGRAKRLYQRMRAEMSRIPAAHDIGELVRHEAGLIAAMGEIVHGGAEGQPRGAEGENRSRAAGILRLHLSRMQICQQELERQQAGLAELRDALVKAEDTMNEPVEFNWDEDAGEGRTP